MGPAPSPMAPPERRLEPVPLICAPQILADYTDTRGPFDPTFPDNNFNLEDFSTLEDTAVLEKFDSIASFSKPTTPTL